MHTSPARPQRFIGLDLHKHYLIACTVDAEQQLLGSAQRVELSRLDNWIRTQLSTQDAVVLEMTTNTWDVYDALAGHVHSVTVVHPPHLALITRAQVMTDKIAAQALAKLLAAGLLVGIWIPPPAVRDLRALIAQRSKFVRLSTQAKNRLHAVLHRHRLRPPDAELFAAAQRDWWQALALSPAEAARVQGDLRTLDFARAEIAHCDDALKTVAAADPRVPLLIQLPGFSLITALSVLAALGSIDRFPDAKQLVGYAGLGARVHASGLSHTTGRITKAGRRDLRCALVEAAQSAVMAHPFWRATLERLEPRLGRNKAIVAIARKLLVVVWHVLRQSVADLHADVPLVARKLLQHAYRLGQAHRTAGQGTASYVREQLDRLHIGSELESVAWGQKHKPIPLPPSRWHTADG